MLKVSFKKKAAPVSSEYLRVLQILENIAEKRFYESFTPNSF